MGGGREIQRMRGEKERKKMLCKCKIGNLSIWGNFRNKIGLFYQDPQYLRNIPLCYGLLTAEGYFL